MHQSEHWRQYWRTSKLSACGGCEDSYAIEIEDYWAGFFSSLTHAQTVLDLGVGNGALVRLAIKAAFKNRLSIKLTGVDCAQIDDHNLSDFATSHGCKYEGYSNTDMVDLPSLDGEYDIIVSQFALEYSEWEITLKALVRQLAPYGQVSFVLHNAEGVYYKGAKLELEIAQFFSEKANLIKLTADFVYNNKDSFRVKRNLQKCEGFVEYKAQGKSLYVELITAFGLKKPPVFVENIYEVVGSLILGSHQLKKCDINMKLQQLEKSLNEHLNRLTDLVTNAFDEVMVKRLVSILGLYGLNCVTQHQIVRQLDNQKIAWVLAFKRDQHSG